jgi:RNA polymerase sigma-70 factor (ECF subfamily)
MTAVALVRRISGPAGRPMSRVDAMPADQTAARSSDAAIVARLRAGDEAAFASVIQAWSPGMLRTARCFVADAYAAEDVVQEAWLGVLAGLDRFELRSSLRTWAYQILINIARARGRRDARTVPAGSLSEDGPTVAADRFHGAGPYAGHWRTPPTPWREPEDSALDAETRDRIEAALDRLPGRQRAVIVLRDVDGRSADEVCRILEITAENQRVLLHRARAQVRAALAEYLEGR